MARGRIATAAALTAAAASVCAIVLSARTGPPREIRLTVRDMAFFAEGSDQPNPTLRLRRGETVRLVLANAEQGTRHDFAIPAWGVATARIEGPDETAIVFRAASDSGTTPYRCDPHAAMMKGTIVVE